MAVVEEEIPMMALAEDGEQRVVYAYQAATWLLATLLPGLAATGAAVWLHLAFDDITLLVTLPLFIFGAIMLYSTWYSLTADQWLMFDGDHHLVRFHKKNLYGRIDWEYPGSEFEAIRVIARSGQDDWILQLAVRQHQDLLFGDSAFRKMPQARARKLAEKAGRLAGIPVEIAD